MYKTIVSAFLAVGVLALSGQDVQASSAGAPELKKPAQGWSWTPVFGDYDKKALYRGFEVFNGVCANCHGLHLIAYRNLAAVGLTEDQIKEVAAAREKPDLPNEEGVVAMRPGVPSDRWIPPFPNDMAAAAANGGAVPPDLSLMAKARVGGPNYIYSLMLGYHENPPEGFEMPDGKSYNDYFPGHAISMVPPLFEDGVTYTDGTPATVEQMAYDVTTFLNWAAEPELGERKSLGWKVMLFVGILTIMLYALKRQIWRDVH